jgi:hypothetical protein
VSYKIEVPDVPPSLNKVLRMHWAKKRDLRDVWNLTLGYGCWAGRQGVLNKKTLQGMVRDMTKMRVTVTLYNARQYDKDNAYGACKIIFDALKTNGLIVDDRAEFLEASVEQVKSTRKGKKTVIEIGPASGEELSI